MLVILLSCSCVETKSSLKQENSLITNVQQNSTENIEDPLPSVIENPTVIENPEPEPQKLVSPSGVEMLPCPTEIPEGMACVSGGPFFRGTDQEHTCGQSENKRYKTKFGPLEEIWLQTYLIDITEVTYGAYKTCMASKKCSYAKPAYQDFNHPEQPMMGASWYAAQKYCEAQGKQLPTEAQWEKAARGDNQDNTPFGTELVTCADAVIKDGSGRSCGVKKKGSHPDKGKVWKVAQKSIGKYGVYDMVGNAEEWVYDWFAPSLELCGDDCKGTDPKGPCAGKSTCKKFALRDGKALKMVKGGSWYWPAQDATAWHRRPHVPTNKPYHHFGFRCAKTLTTSKE